MHISLSKVPATQNGNLNAKEKLPIKFFFSCSKRIGYWKEHTFSVNIGLYTIITELLASLASLHASVRNLPWIAQFVHSLHLQKTRNGNLFLVALLLTQSATNLICIARVEKVWGTPPPPPVGNNRRFGIKMIEKFFLKKKNIQISRSISQN